MIARDWKDYEIIATGNGEKLERWGEYFLLRPDPQVIWPAAFDLKSFKGLCAKYIRSSSGGGSWQHIKKIPDQWTIDYKDYKFSLKLMGFKHVGLFPEQASNWDKISRIIKEANVGANIATNIGTKTDKLKDNSVNKLTANANPYNLKPNGKDVAEKGISTAPKGQINVLNLFAYTGGATVAAALAGARVTHVDAAKGMVERAGLNAKLSNVPADRIRYIVDDCAKFVSREIRRGVRYDAVIMDPPSFGRGTAGEVWKLEDNLFSLVQLCSQVLTDNPLFFLINSYTTGLQPTALENILALCLKDFMGKGGKTEGYEVCIQTKEGIPLPCGCSAIFINR